MKPYKIEKGIKLPEAAQAVSDGTASRASATMSALLKGESFLIKDALEGLRAEKQMRDKNARERRRGSGKVFASRRLEAGVRIWCLK
jgi:hypothetical protein